MAQHEHVVARRLRGLSDRGHQPHAVIQRLGRLRADRPVGRQPHVCDHNVRAGACHRLGFVGSESIGRRQQVQVAGRFDQLDFQAVTHARLFQTLPESAVDQTHGREVLNPREAEGFQFLQEKIPNQKRVGATHTRQHRRSRNGGQHFKGHLLDDLIRIAIRHHA